MILTNKYRRGFGLVELLVAMALSIGIMWILAEAFKMGLDFTRHARSTGSMMTRLDGARAVIARDLLAEHFLPDDSLPPGSNRGVRLSDLRFDRMNNGGSGWYPPKGGFFRIISPASTLVGNDGNYDIHTATSHALHFTSILPATDRNPYSVNAPAGGSLSYSSRAAEIGYFLVDSGRRTSPGPSGQTLYYLVRRQRLVALSVDEMSAVTPRTPNTWASTDPANEVIAGNGTSAYTLADMTNPGNRLPISPSTVGTLPASAPTFGITSNRYGEDMLLDNVLSFEVLVDWTQSAVTGSTLPPRSFASGNGENPFDTLHYAGGNAGQNSTFTNAGIFDTWIGSPANPTWNIGLGSTAANTQKLPLAIRVKAIQITVRIWDSKTRQGRQSTWKIAM